jgi:hypothetical protein
MHYSIRATKLIWKDGRSTAQPGHHLRSSNRFSPTTGARFGLSPNGQICLASIQIDDLYKDMLHPFDCAIRINQEGTMIQQESSVFEKIQDQVGCGNVGCLQADIVHLLAEQFTNINSQPTMVENNPFCVVTSSPLF